jgi:putative toxin-antitoxin system antitoxin component (TIGR02293 family)
MAQDKATSKKGRSPKVGQKVTATDPVFDYDPKFVIETLGDEGGAAAAAYHLYLSTGAGSVRDVWAKSFVVDLNALIDHDTRSALMGSTILNAPDNISLTEAAEVIGAIEAQDKIDGWKAREIKDLMRQASTESETQNPDLQFESVVFRDTVEILGGQAILGHSIRTELDLLRAVVRGFPVGVLGQLRNAGYRTEVLEKTIAPRRTLARRKSSKQRLTRGESDAAWRLAHVLATACYVLKDAGAAIGWLNRPKAALSNNVPIDLLDTSIGALGVERLLRRLESGNIA